MSSPRSSRYDFTSKKSRATSCTNCRQVKLKCDLKEKYPNPCSRCAANHHDCRTDASFKRIPARSRIKDLESQIDQLKRDRAFSQATSRSSAEYTPEFERRVSDNSSANVNLAVYPVSEGLSHDSPTNSDLSRTEARWLNLTELDEPTHFMLEATAVPYTQVLELFQHFEDHYYPHFCILEPIASLKQIHAESHFLFWAILCIAARSHRHYAPLADTIRPILDGLQANVITGAISSLPDLQAILLLCAFPFHESCPLYKDTAWPQLGLAIHAARQMGLDKDRGEILFGSRESRDSINRHPRHIRQMTWLKCFELDVQMSCWHGHLPSLISPQVVRTVTRICEGLHPSKYTALVSVDAELAQGLAALEDTIHAPTHVVHVWISRLDAVKTRWAHGWTLDAELELLMAKLYLHAACLVMTDKDEGFYHESMQDSHAAATQLAYLVTNLSMEAQANALTYGFAQNYYPLPGHPKPHVQSAFFAAIVLYNDLDNENTRVEEKETARNAFGKVFQMFSTCSSTSGSSESFNAARMLQVMERAMGRGSSKLKPLVTTRMGASLIHNAVWLASQIQAGEMPPPHEDNLGPSPLPENAFVIPPSSQPYTGPSEEYINQYATATAPFGDTMLNAPMWDQPVSMPNIELPLGVWDNSVFDGWQIGLSYPPVTQMDLDAVARSVP